MIYDVDAIFCIILLVVASICWLFLDDIEKQDKESDDNDQNYY